MYKVIGSDWNGNKTVARQFEKEEDAAMWAMMQNTKPFQFAKCWVEGGDDDNQ